MAKRVVLCLCLVLALWIVLAPMISGCLAEATRAGVDRLTAMQKVEAAVALGPRDERARATRGRLRHQAAVEVWTSGATLDGRVLASWEERHQAALPLATGAVQDFNVAVREVGEQILFLHRLQPGGADRSYGIEVGRLAGLPTPVLARARDILALLEGEHLGGARGTTRVSKPAQPPDQLGLFATAPHPVVDRLAALDINTMTPIEALTTLAKLVDEAKR